MSQISVISSVVYTRSPLINMQLPGFTIPLPGNYNMVSRRPAINAPWGGGGHTEVVDLTIVPHFENASMAR